jgi:hypothetical protein
VSGCHMHHGRYMEERKTAACLSSLTTLQGGSISVWHDHAGSLKYTMHSYNRLQPTIKSEALGLNSSILTLIPCFPSFLDSADAATGASRPVISAPNMMWVLAVMSGGQLWRWRVPLPLPEQSFESLCAEGTYAYVLTHSLPRTVLL